MEVIRVQIKNVVPCGERVESALGWDTWKCPQVFVTKFCFLVWVIPLLCNDPLDYTLDW